MGMSNSIKHKLFFLLIVMGAIPFIIVIIMSSMNMITDWEISVEKNGMLRNTIISEHVTELFEKNFYVLHATAVNSKIVDYVQNPQSQNQNEILYLLQDTNEIFRDKNTMALTSSHAEQLIRTDGSKLVNIKNRKHFHEAMKGNDFVSDVIVSMSTGKMIVVLTTPIKNKKNIICGVIQRNLDLEILHDFVETHDDKELSVIILDREGRVIVDSERQGNNAENFWKDESYKFLSEHITKGSGIIKTTVNGEEALVSYSKNTLTDWVVITVQPYKFIMNQIYSEIFKYALVALLMLLIVSGVAYWTSVHATKPIIEITKAANIMASGSVDVENLKVDSTDELGKMAEAFNKMKIARDTYQMEAKTDTLTQLYNKATFENICRKMLQEFKDEEDNETLMALFIIDLDHFKEVNDTKGHQFGDKVLKKFAKQLRKSFRPYDGIGRFGGDEFLVIINNLPDTEIITRKAEIINKVARELKIDGENANITASVGIAIVPNDGTEYEEIFRAADKSLYFVKKHGRNNFYCESLNRGIL